MDENREFKLFDDYTSYITKRIMSKKKEAEVREEYSSHLMEEYERQTYLGKSHIEAQVLAIESMGDKELIKEQFGKLYPVIPFQYMKSSFNFLIWGLLLSSFYINIFFEGFSEITKFIGSALWLYGLFKLRNTDKKINIAFFIDVGLSLVSLVVGHFGKYLIDPTNYTLIAGTIALFIRLIAYGLLFAGINNLCKSLKCDSVKKPNLLLGYISYCLFGLIIFLAMLGGAVLVYAAPIFLIITLWQLRNAKKYLANENEEIELRTVISAGEKIAYCVLVIVLAVTPIVSMLAVAGAQPEIEVYNPIDTEYGVDEVDQVRFEMVLLGMPEDILDDLPDSEVMKYKGATYLHISQDYSFLDQGVKGAYQYFIFFFPQGEARTLLRLDIEDESSCKYRNGLYISHNRDDWNKPDSSTENGDFFIALCNKDTETVKSEIESTYTPNGSIWSFNTTGFEFKFPKGSVSRRAYIGVQAVLQNRSDRHFVGIDGYFLFERNPITPEWNSMNTVAQNLFDQSRGMFSTVDTGNFQRVGLSHSFEIKAEYVEE